MPPNLAKILRGIQTGKTDHKPTPQVKPHLLLLTGLAIAESYHLLPAGSLARLLEGGDVSGDQASQRRNIRSAIVESCQDINQRYGTVFPTRWLRSSSLDSNPKSNAPNSNTIYSAEFHISDRASNQDCDQDCDQAILTAVGYCLVAGLAQATIGAELLGQVYECLIDPLALAQEHNPSKKRSSALRRKRQGAYYTPSEIVGYMVEQTVGVGLSGHHPHRLQSAPSVPTDFSVLDPSCGGGIFLLVAYRYLLAWHQHQACCSLTLEKRQHLLQTSIAGVDLDPWAIEVTRLGLHLEILRETQTPVASVTSALSRTLCQAIRTGNAVIDDTEFTWQTAFSKALSGGGFDVVIGNPPYLDSEAMTAWLPQWRRYCTQQYQAAQGNWDLFCIFIEKALGLCKPGGIHSFVVPNKLLSASYATTTRSLLTQHSQLKIIRDYSQTNLFDAAVYPIVYVAERRSSQTSTSTTAVQYELMRQGDAGCEVETSRLVPMTQLTASTSGWIVDTNARRAELLQNLSDRFPTLGKLAQVTGAATVAEAYQLKPLIHSWTDRDTSENSLFQSWSKNGDRHFQVINSGTIDRYHSLWAEKPLRYLGDRILCPLVSSHALKQLLPRRHQQASTTKLIVASMTRQLEAIADLDGCILAGKSTCIIQNSQLPLLYVLGLLNSRLVNLLMLQSSKGNRLQGGYLRIGPSQLRCLPIPLLTSMREKQWGDRLIELVKARQTPNNFACHRATRDDSAPFPSLTEESLEQSINQVVYQLYGLEEQDISVIEDYNGNEV